MELLIIRRGKEYIRIMDGNYAPCPIEKASVFPRDSLDIVKTHADRLREEGGLGPVSIRRLLISEEPFVDTDNC